MCKDGEENDGGARRWGRCPGGLGSEDGKKLDARNNFHSPYISPAGHTTSRDQLGGVSFVLASVPLVYFLFFTLLLLYFFFIFVSQGKRCRHQAPHLAP